MKAYKHIDKEYAARFASGESIQVGLMSAYQEGEGTRVDPLEGRVSNKINYLRTNTVTPAHQMALRSVGIWIDGTGSLTVRNGTGIMTLAPRLIFCASSAPNEALRAEGQSIYEISDFEAFATILTQADPKLLSEPLVGKVIYKRREGDAILQGPVFPEPFAKSERFSLEKELRIVWAPTNEREKYQRIRALDAAALIRRA